MKQYKNNFDSTITPIVEKPDMFITGLVRNNDYEKDLAAYEAYQSIRIPLTFKTDKDVLTDKDIFIDDCCANSCDGFKCKSGSVHLVAYPAVEGNSITKYFIEDLRNGKWVKMPQSYEDLMIDTSRSFEDEEERKWTNDPNQAMQWDNKEEAELHNKKYWNMIDIEVTEHEFVTANPSDNVQSDVPQNKTNEDWKEKAGDELWDIVQDVDSSSVEKITQKIITLIENNKSLIK